MKKCILRLFLLILLFGAGGAGFDYGKHYILRTKIQALCKKHGITVADTTIQFDRGAATLHLGTVTKNQMNIAHVRLRIPYKSFSSCTVTVNSMVWDAVKIHWSYGVVASQDENIDVSYYALKDVEFSLLEQDFFVDQIEGKISYHPEKFVYTIYSDMIKTDGENIFKLASHGTIDHVIESEKRSGNMEVRVSSIQNAFQLLEESHVLPSWQAALFKNIVRDNTYIPFSIKKRTIFLGPLKIATLDF